MALGSTFFILIRLAMCLQVHLFLWQCLWEATGSAPESSSSAELGDVKINLKAYCAPICQHSSGMQKEDAHTK